MSVYWSRSFSFSANLLYIVKYRLDLVNGFYTEFDECFPRVLLPNFYALAVRDGDTVKHYRIRQLDEGGFFIARRVTFRTLAELVDHYSRDADGLCVNLKKPCSQVI
jgi:hypothetical protein